MTDKQPQTCYVPSNEESIGILSTNAGDAQYILLKELPDRYIFTKEELEEYVREKQREAADKAWEASKSCAIFCSSIYVQQGTGKATVSFYESRINRKKLEYLSTNYPSPKK